MSAVTIIAVLLASFCLASAIYDAEMIERAIGSPMTTARKSILPYYVRIKENDKEKCGGALVSPWHVLTSAYCVDSQFSNWNYAPIMTVEVTRSERARNNFNVKRIIRHPNYTSSDEPNYFDVAVITLQNPVPLRNAKTTISLPRRSLQSYQESDDSQGMLMVTFGSVVRASICQRPRFLNEPILHVCPIKKSTKIQSGSILTDRRNSKVLGVLSGKGCIHSSESGCGRSQPIFYTKASEYMGLIQREMDAPFSIDSMAGSARFVRDLNAYYEYSVVKS